MSNLTGCIHSGEMIKMKNCKGKQADVYLHFPSWSYITCEIIQYVPKFLGSSRRRRKFPNRTEHIDKCKELHVRDTQGT